MRGVRLRRATLSDGEILFRWRNDPTARRQYLNSAAVRRSDHDRWFARTLADPRCCIYLAEDPRGRRIGQFRLKQFRGGAEISVSVARQARGQGIGATLVHRAAAVARRDLGVSRVVAYVRPENIASAVAFLRAGYRFSRNAVRRGVRMYVFECVAS